MFRQRLWRCHGSISGSSLPRRRRRRRWRHPRRGFAAFISMKHMSATRLTQSRTLTRGCFRANTQTMIQHTCNFMQRPRDGPIFRGSRGHLSIGNGGCLSVGKARVMMVTPRPLVAARPLLLWFLLGRLLRLCWLGICICARLRLGYEARKQTLNPGRVEVLIGEASTPQPRQG